MKILIILTALLSVSAMAQEVVTFKNPTYKGARAKGEIVHFAAISHRDGLCRFLGAKSYVKGSIKTDYARKLYYCDTPSDDSNLFIVIDMDGHPLTLYRSRYWETRRSHFALTKCTEDKSEAKKISEIKCRM